ncbi:zinc ribbon domain-containing protein [Staphylococcus equorum]|uniref:Cas12f1-like TNB domain-containing protein n=1 Tax=Staphylococcus equorum TaxID=246432 RepID=A0AAP7LUZ1_9STAP|nr:zinc ribbon domain-containing protein [Staphylococcus equorum]OEK58820.1 hypothetical protein ASS94_01315 [Staphylococcus equorum]
MIIDTKEIEEYITKLPLDEVSDMEVPEDILKNLKHDYQNIFQYNLSTAIKLQNAVNRYKKEVEIEREEERQELIKQRKVKYIGVDVGQTRIITASDYEMDNYIILKEKNLTARIKKYNKDMDNLMKAKNHKGKKLLLESFKKYVKNIVENELLYKLEIEYKQPTVFIIGKNYLIEDKYSSQNVLTDSIYTVFKEASLKEPSKSNGIVDVDFVNERYTSVKCPECKNGSPENKSKDGFKCSNCSFYHKRPDVVACRNMLDKYFKKK